MGFIYSEGEPLRCRPKRKGREDAPQFWPASSLGYAVNFDACSPRVPQLLFGMSWIIMCRDSGLTPMSSNALAIPLMSFSFCSSVLPAHICTVTTGMFSPRNLFIHFTVLSDLRYAIFLLYNSGGFKFYCILGILFGVRNVVNLSRGMAGMLIISMVPRDPNSTERWAIASLPGASTILTKS